jgi:hypothetical protein
MSEGTIKTHANLSTQIPGISGGSVDTHAPAASLEMTSFGISFTGSMSAGFTIRFMKG